MMGKTYISMILSLVLVPLFAQASISITEIYYDAPGTDTGHEWIEIYNDSSSSVDITGWKFREGGTNHLVNEYTGGFIINPQSYAIIADNPSVFIGDFGSIDHLFDSSFSLSNEGELLELINSSGEIVDSVSYPAEEAQGDGNSLNKVSGSWQPRVPSPGEIASTDQSQPPDSTSTGSGGYTIAEPVERKEKEEIKDTPTLSVVYPSSVQERVEVDFAATVENHNKSDVAYRWNFGDGVRDEGGEVSHEYEFPGKYTVHVEAVRDGEVWFEDSKAITVSEYALALGIEEYRGRHFVWIENQGSKAADLSRWILVAGDSLYRLEEDTVVLPDTQTVISLTGSLEKDNVSLLDDKGEVVVSLINGGQEEGYSKDNDSKDEELLQDQEILRAQVEEYLQRTNESEIPNILDSPITANLAAAAQAQAPLKDRGSNDSPTLLILVLFGATIATLYVVWRRTRISDVSAEALEYEIIEE